MKALVLNRFGLSAMDYPGWLGPDVQVHLLTSAAAAAGQDDALRRCADVRLVESYADDPEVELLALEWHAAVGFDALVAMSEFDLLRAARLRAVLGLPGQQPDSAEAYRDKLRMKHVLRSASVPVVRHAAVDFTTDLLAFADAVPGPLVVKPRRGAASVGVHVLPDRHAVLEHVRRSVELRGDDPAHLIAEEFVDHELVHVDGAWRDGELVVAWPSRATSQLGFHASETLFSSMLEPDDPRVGPAVDLVRAALRALPTPDVSLFHAELFLTPTGELLVNEIGCRMGGGRIKTAMEVAFGVNLEEWYVRNVLSDEPWHSGRRTPGPLAGFAIIPPAPGRLVSAPSTCPVPGVRRYKVEAEVGSELAPARANGDAMASVTVEGSTEAEVLGRLGTATAWVTENLVVV